MSLRDCPAVRRLIQLALEEDIGEVDWTTQATIPPEREGRAVIIARKRGVVAGLEVAAMVFETLDAGVRFEPRVQDGDEVASGQVLAEVSGRLQPILTGERVALNFLQRLSGVATKTQRLASLIAHTPAKLLDTRKTTPGMRVLEKYAVRCGGGYNHRVNLSQAILIKDNHVIAAGGVGEAVQLAREKAPDGLVVEVEVDNLAELEEAIAAGADVVLLDNMLVEELRQAVKLCAGRCQLEASGGVSEDTIVEIAETGVDMISSGALTHSAPALDISMEVIG